MIQSFYFCQAQSKLIFFNFKLIQLATHPYDYEEDRKEQHLENKSCKSKCVDPKYVLGPYPKKKDIRPKKLVLYWLSFRTVQPSFIFSPLLYLISKGLEGLSKTFVNLEFFNKMNILCIYFLQ